MSYGPRTTETECLTERARQNALRVFVTRINQPTSNIVFSLNPGDLPNALARAKEIESNQTRMKNLRQRHSRQPGPNQLFVQDQSMTRTTGLSKTDTLWIPSNNGIDHCNRTAIRTILELVITDMRGWTHRVGIYCPRDKPRLITLTIKDHNGLITHMVITRLKETKQVAIR